jgi:hypothetical protein
MGTTIVHWFHVFFAAFWLGALLYVNFIAIPVINKELSSDMATLNRFVLALSAHATKVIFPVAVLAIIFGFLRGTVFGPLKGIEAVTGTTYGHYWLGGLVGGCSLLAWGIFLVGPAAKKVASFPPDEVAKGGAVADSAKAALKKLQLVAVLEVVGFFIVFTLMVLMRFTV